MCERAFTQRSKQSGVKALHESHCSTTIIIVISRHELSCIHFGNVVTEEVPDIAIADELREDS